MKETAGTRIEALARERGLPTSPRELAAELGVSYETLRKWREGLAAPNRNRAKAIATRLGVAPEQFMYGAQGNAQESEAANAGHDEQESRLLAAFRAVLSSDRAGVLAQLEKRAAEVDELRAQILDESSKAPSRKRLA